MRRQGRQHGLVRTYRVLPPPLNPRLVNSLTSPQNAELSTKLPSKPTKTNHSKSNRKVWPRQVHWVRSNDIASSSYKLLTWQVSIETGSGSEPVLNLPGFSDTEDNGRDGEGGVETLKTENNNGDVSEKEDGGSHDYDESMSFYDVGMMMMEHVLDEDEKEEDGWCLV